MQSQILGIKNAGAFDLSELKHALSKDSWFLSISKHKITMQVLTTEINKVMY